MKFFILFLAVFIGFSSSAAIPTSESLFRNGNNKNISGNFVVLKFEINEHSTNEEKNLIKSSAKDIQEEQLMMREKYPVRYAKLIFSLEKDETVQLLQVMYSDNEMKSSSLNKVNYIKNLNQFISNDPNVERTLFYSLLMMFSLNDSSGMANVLKSHNQKFVANESLLNVDKKNLLERYKIYLLAIKKDKTLVEELISPLKPEEPEERAKISQILNSSMYNKVNDVSLIRENRKFFWKVNYENFLALFNHETHRLNKINFTSNLGTLEGVFGDYILFDGIHELPKISLLKRLDGKSFKIRMLSLREFTNSGKKLNIRAQQYQKLLSANKVENIEHSSDKFFYYDN